MSDFPALRRVKAANRAVKRLSGSATSFFGNGQCRACWSCEQADKSRWSSKLENERFGRLSAFSTARFWESHAHALAGLAICDARAPEGPRILGRCHTHAGARHWREYRGVFGGGRNISTVPGSIHFVSKLPRLDADEPHLRRARGLPSNEFQFDRLGRSATAERRAGYGELFLVAWCTAADGPRFLARGRQEGCRARGPAQREFLEQQVWGIAGNPGPAANAGRHRLYGRWCHTAQFLFLLRIDEFRTWGRLRADWLGRRLLADAARFSPGDSRCRAHETGRNLGASAGGHR